MNTQRRITIFVLHHEDASDFEWVQAWILKWKRANQLTIVDYSSGGWEHLWDIEACTDAVAEVPENYLCDSEWSNSALFNE